MNDVMRDEILSLSGAKPSWSRRDFVASGLASGFALAAGPVCAQTMIVTDTKGINAGEVAFHADYRPTYRKAQADDGWKRLQEWFKKYL